jgi:hypothetical protein
MKLQPLWTDNSSHRGPCGHCPVVPNLVIQPARVLVCPSTTRTAQLTPSLWQCQVLLSSRVSRTCCYICYGADVQTQAVATQIPKAEAAPNDFPFWPAETDLVFTSGSNKLKLTSQTPIVRSVIVEAIENLRAAMLMTDAFPDVCSALSLIKDCLLTAGTYLLPGAMDVLDRLKNDPDYLTKITLLVRLFVSDDFVDDALQPRARISLIRSEVKERCTTLTMGTFLALGSATDIIEHVRKQVSSYTYTFPGATFVSHIKTTSPH